MQDYVGYYGTVACFRYARKSNTNSQCQPRRFCKFNTVTLAHMIHAVDGSKIRLTTWDGPKTQKIMGWTTYQILSTGAGFQPSTVPVTNQPLCFVIIPCTSHFTSPFWHKAPAGFFRLFLGKSSLASHRHPAQNVTMRSWTPESNWRGNHHTPPDKHSTSNRKIENMTFLLGTGAVLVCMYHINIT